MITPNWPYIRLRMRRLFQPPIELPRKEFAHQFGGGRSRGVYLNEEIVEFLCSVAGCGAHAHASWAGCADNNIMRPLCPEHDVQLNVIALLWWGDPAAATKIDEYVQAIESDIGRRVERWAYDVESSPILKNICAVQNAMRSWEMQPQ